MAYATQTAVSNGSMVALNVTIEYLYRSEISVYFGSTLQASGWRWADLNAATILFDTAVPVGTVVKLKRRTDISKAFHVYSNGAMFDRASMDDNFRQMLHVAQEIQEGEGTTAATADLDMQGYRILNVGAGVNPGDAVNKQQLDSAVISGGGSTGANLPAGGYNLYAGNTGTVLNFRQLVAGTGISLSQTSNGITVNATGGGGGGSWDGFADITDFGGVGDFVPAAGGLGTGTDNATALLAAIATGKPLYIPTGNFYVSTWPARSAYSRATAMGPGKVWGDTGRGKQILGKTLFVGATNTHEISYAGGVLWLSLIHI